MTKIISPTTPPTSLKEPMTIMRGDAYEIALTLTDEEDAPITDADVADVEITLDKVSKTYAKGEVIYTDGTWLFPITQDETLSTIAAVSGLQVRVKYALGDVVGAKVGNVYVLPSNSREVL